MLWSQPSPAQNPVISSLGEPAAAYILIQAGPQRWDLIGEAAVGVYATEGLQRDVPVGLKKYNEFAKSEKQIYMIYMQQNVVFMKWRLALVY